MKRILQIVLLAVAPFAGEVIAEAQTGKVFRIGLLDNSTAYGMAVLIDAFRQELSTLGWIEGKNLIIDYRFGENKGGERNRELARELARLKVDLIVASASPSALAAKRATTTIPIVMAGVGDPVGLGLVGSLAQPGGNVTGFSSLTPDINTKRLEVLKDAVPKLVRVGLLRLPNEGVSAGAQLKEIRPAAVALKLNLEEIKAETDAKGLESAFETAKQKRLQAFMTLATRGFFGERKRIVELATKHRLPGMYFQREFVDEGGLMFYGVNFENLFRKTAHYVDKILKGTKPAELPVQQATKIEFVINLKAAKQIGLEIPQWTLMKADRVIK